MTELFGWMGPKYTPVLPICTLLGMDSGAGVQRHQKDPGRNTAASLGLLSKLKEFC